MKKMKIIRASSNVVGVGRQTRSRAGNFLVAIVLTLWRGVGATAGVCHRQCLQAL